MKELLNMGLDEFNIKLNSIPESEPLYKIFKSRAIKLNQIKDKEERKYWRELKKANKIPDIYLRPEELDEKLKEQVKEGGFNHAK